MDSANPEPVLIYSDSETCTHFFSFHTPHVCEQTVSGSSVNSSLINRLEVGTNEPRLSSVTVLFPVQVKCSVQNGSDLIELTPLIHANGYYTATDEAVGQSDGSPDFYINICQALNPIPGVSCPPGAAVCMDPDDGPPVVKQSHLMMICFDGLYRPYFLPLPDCLRPNTRFIPPVIDLPPFCRISVG